MQRMTVDGGAAFNALVSSRFAESLHLSLIQLVLLGIGLLKCRRVFAEIMFTGATTFMQSAELDCFRLSQRLEGLT